MFKIMFWDVKNQWTEIATVDGCEASYEIFCKACEFAELIGKACGLMDAETGEIIDLVDENGERVK